MGYSPLANATEWMDGCRKREKKALANKNGPGSERRLATTLRKRAEETVQLIQNARKEHAKIQDAAREIWLVLEAKLDKPLQRCYVGLCRSSN